MMHCGIYASGLYIYLLFFIRLLFIFIAATVEDEPKKFQITIKPAAEKTTASLDEFRSIQLTLPTSSVWVSIFDASCLQSALKINVKHYFVFSKWAMAVRS